MTKFWDHFSSFEEAEKDWDEGAKKAAKTIALKGASTPSQRIKISKETKGLRWKGFKWLLKSDKGEIKRGFFKSPFYYSIRFIRSLLSKGPYRVDGDHFFFGIKDEKQFLSLLIEEENLFLLGFSYCHKPFECPSGRFSADCIHDPLNFVCRQCFIGKAFHALPEKGTHFLVIPTVYDIGKEIFSLLQASPKQRLCFAISACEMMLRMFADYGNMVGVRGVGIRLQGRVCSTMKAFALAEEGIKPGLTSLSLERQRAILDWIRLRRGRRSFYQKKVKKRLF